MVCTCTNHVEPCASPGSFGEVDPGQIVSLCPRGGRGRRDRVHFSRHFQTDLPAGKPVAQRAFPPSCPHGDVNSSAACGLRHKVVAFRMIAALPGLLRSCGCRSPSWYMPQQSISACSSPILQISGAGLWNVPTVTDCGEEVQHRSFHQILPH